MRAAKHQAANRPRRRGGGGLIGQDPVDRFNAKISHVDEKGCHVWGGALNSKGYGCFCWGGKGKSVLAHRWAFEHLGGKRIPEGLVIDHRCRNHACVNPEHMRVVTNKVNILAGTGFSARNAAKKFCVRGHALRGDNVKVDGRAKRRCRECDRLRNRKYQRKKYWENRGGEKSRQRARQAVLKETA